PIYQDELSNIYDATCMAETGADRWGTRHPLLLRAFGDLDYRPPLQAWLTIIPMKIGGFSVGLGRAVSGVLGTLTVLLVVVVARPLLGPGGALLAGLLVTLSPWHLLFSRMAHEGTALPPFCVALALWLWQRARARRYRSGAMLALGLALGMATSAYQASRLVAVLMGCLVVGELASGVWRRPTRWRRLAPGFLALAGGAVLAALPQLWAAWTQSEHFFARARDRFITTSGPVDLGTQVVRSLGANLSPRFLFLSSGTFNYLSVGRALPVEAPFFYLGIAVGWWCLPGCRRGRLAKVLAVLVICVLPAALTEAEPQALRASGASALLGLFSCLGLLAATGLAWAATGAAPVPDHPRALRRWRCAGRGVLAGAAVAVTACATALIVAYWHSDRLRSEWHQPILVRMGQWLGQHGGAWERVIVDPAGIQPYLYVAAFSGMSPQEFQAAPKEFSGGDWYEFRRLGRYEFLGLAETMDRWREAGFPAWLVVLRNAAPQYGRVLDEVSVGHERVVFAVLEQVPSQTGEIALDGLPFEPGACEFAPPVANAAFNNGPLDLGGVRHLRGIGMHAPCKARFRLPPGSWRLRATAGVGDSARECELAMVHLAVLGDSDRPLAEVGPLRSGDDPWQVDIDLSGQSTVTLDVGDAGNGRDCDHVVWTDARLVPMPVPGISRPVGGPR
ncbi:MAG: NPCBM/NEW2 domain-containing protein, partial [Thermoanaerobaculaceae bacterium]|nr:NPCBM/NEW2 domain-containing protein [Thermoanaerobaculaceae bacterium]